MKYLLCLLLGHRLYPTGRELVDLFQVQCHRCEKFYCCNEMRPGEFLPFHYFEPYFSEMEEYDRQTQR